MLEVAQNHPDILQSPSPQILFKGFGDSSLDFELLIWTAQPHRQFLLKSDLNFRIFEVFRQHQIEILYPQHDLHLRSVQITPEFEPTLNQLLSQPSSTTHG